MMYKHIFFISPPFYSHFNPFLVLAKSFKDKGLEVTLGCSIEFKDEVLKEDLNFYEIDISSNKNIGNSKTNMQPDKEQMRLDEFFESTRLGAIETLITQSNHRKADMLYNPQELIEKLKIVDTLLNIDIFVVDILSYSVTLSLYFLELPFITFCPPHPNTIPVDGEYYGVPNNWPSPIKVNEEDLKRLREVSIDTQNEFTHVFNSIISKNKSIAKIDNAFSLVSEVAIIYNYFDFNNIKERVKGPKNIFIGNCFKEEALNENWVKRIKSTEKKIMITLGTFLSNRKDVLQKLIIFVREIYPQAILIVSAGSNAEKLRKLSSANTIIEDFIPQIALMPHIDTIIYHGGCNSFTESIYYGKEMLVLPFSSDQFNIAYDIEKNNLGKVIDPNDFNKEDLLNAFEYIENMPKNNLKYWSNISRQRGPDYGVKRILNI